MKAAVPDDADSVPTTCVVCGATSDLKRASVPPIGSIAAATDVELGDTEPPPCFVDANWYCARCRFRVNLRRALCAVVFVVLMLLAAAFGRPW